MKNLKKLSRGELKTVRGGTGTYRCCWDKEPGNCSSTINISHEESSNLSCVDGAHLEEVG